MGFDADDLKDIIEILKLIKAILDAIKEIFADDKDAQARVTEAIVKKVVA